MSENNNLFISMYYYVRDLKHSRYLGIKGMDVFQFRNQMGFFRENFHVVTIEQVIDTIKGSSVLPERAVWLTLDDGYIDNFSFV